MRLARSIPAPAPARRPGRRRGPIAFAGGHRCASLRTRPRAPGPAARARPRRRGAGARQASSPRAAASPAREPDGAGRGAGAALRHRPAEPTGRSPRCGAAALGIDPGADYWLAADPVTLEAGRDDVRLAGAVADLAPAEATALMAMLNAHFAADGARVRRAASGRLVRPHRRRPGPRDPSARRGDRAAACARGFPAAPTPARGGAGRARSRCCCTSTRSTPGASARARRPVNSVWFWGGGRDRRRRRARSAATPRRPRAGASRDAAPRSPVRRAPARASTPRSPEPAADDDALVVALDAAWRSRRRRAGVGRARVGGASPRRARRAIMLIADGGRRRVVWTARRPGVAAAARGPAAPARSRGAARVGARAARRALMDIVRRDVPAAAAALAAAGVHPVLARVLAARGVRTPRRARHRSRASAALRRAAGHRRRRGAARRRDRRARAHRRRRRLRRRRRHRLRGRVRGLAALGADVDFLVPNRFEYGYGLTPEIVAEARAQRAAAHRHRRQRDRQPRRRGRGRRARHRGADHRPPPARRDAAGAGADRQSEPAGLRVPVQAPGRRRRDVLRAARHPRAAARARRVRRPRPSPTWRRCSIWWRWARSPTSCRLDRVNRTLVAQGLARIRAGRAQPGVAALFAAAGRDPPARNGVRPRLRRRPAPQCRGPAGRHDARHPLPARRHGGRSAAARHRARPPEPRAARRRSGDAGGGAGGLERGAAAAPRPTPTRCACTAPSGTRAWSASSPRG